MKEKEIKIQFDDKEFRFITRSHSRSDKESLKEIFGDNLYKNLIPDIKNKVVIDVGTYIGDTLVLFNYLGASKIYGFEPHPEMFSLAVRNAELNGIKADISNLGISDKDGRVKIVGRATISFGLGKGPFLDKVKNCVEVEMKDVNKVLSDLLQKHNQIGLLKVDSEGFEEWIIPSIQIDLLKKIESVLVECHSKKRQI